MDLKDVFEARRSVHYFDTKRSLDPELLRKIYDLAKIAPSSYNLQPWKLIIVSDPQEKKKLRRAAYDQAKVEQASLTIILLADRQGYERMPEICDDMAAKGYIPPAKKPDIVTMADSMYSGPDASLQFCLRNAGLFAMSFMLAAKEYGVDTHPMDGFVADQVRSAFDIPERYVVAMLIAVGYRDQSKQLLPRLDRTPIDQVVLRPAGARAGEESR